MIKFQKRYFIETLETTENNPDHKHNAHMYSSRLQNSFMMNLHFLVLTFAQNLSINVMKIAPIMLHSTKTFLFNTKKVLTL